MDYFLQAKHLGWENEADAIFVDNYFAEAFSWNTGSIKDVSHHTRILSLSSDFEMNSIDEKILNIVIITSCLAKDSVYRLRRLIAKLQCRRVAIFTSVSPELASGIDYSISRRKTHGGSIDNSDYAQLKEVFGHSAISIAYFPLHTIHLLQGESSVQLGVLSSPVSRTAQPLSLPGLRAAAAISGAADTREYKSVLNVNAADLPASMKNGLKSVAHDLAGALVFDYGLDVSASVHALGKTSSILGHNVLPILESLAELRANQGDTINKQLQGMALHAALQSATATGTSSTISKARSGASQVMPLQPAALLLIDRCEDLATPISAGAPLSTTFSSTSTSPIHAPFTAPLAHRILNTLNYCQYLSPPCIPSNNTPATGTGFSECNEVDLQQTQVDVILKAPVLAEAGLEEVAELLGMSAPVAETCSERASADWNKPLSALTNLPLQLNPSLQYRHTAEGSASTDNTLLQRIMAGTEEQSKLTLCAEIKSRIEAEKGALPPNKKRGLGAEVLAFTQALINAPGSAHRSSTSNGECAKAFDLACTNSESAAYKTYREGLSSTGLGYNYSVCLRSQPLLSLSLAVIEGMQRSSGKQFQQLCAWQCAYDVRTAREAEIGQMARKFEDFDICIAHLMSYFLPSKAATAAAVEAACESVGVASPGLKSKASASKLTAGAEKEKETAGPVDVVHVLIQLIRVMSLFRQRVSGTGSSNLSALEECLCDFILQKSCAAELEYLSGLRVLSPTSVQEIETYRLANGELDGLLAQQVDSAQHSRSSSSSSSSDPVAGNVDSLEEQAVTKELLLKQLHSSVWDQIHRFFRALEELQTQYAVQKQSLFSSQVTNSSDAINSTLDLLANESAGLVARIAQAYLSHRAELLRSQNLFSSNAIAASDDGSSERVQLGQLFEFVESPLQKMKRAGLGLLSKGLGSLGFGFGSQVASVASTPHPSEQPVLVIFVLGGISYKEVGQVQQQLLQSNAGSSSGLGGQPLSNTRIILLSTRMLNAENVLYSFCI